MAKKIKKKAAKKTVKKAAKPKAVKKVAPKKAAKKASKKPEPKVKPKTLTLNTHLIFDGNCEEAFNFYKSVFGGKFPYVWRFKEMPTGDGQPIPESDKEKIMHISLQINKEAMLSGSDNLETFGEPTIAGNNFSVSIDAYTQQRADSLYNKLSQGGNAFMPMSKTFWGSYFGMLTDKYGFKWMISARIN